MHFFLGNSILISPLLNTRLSLFLPRWKSLFCRYTFVLHYVLGLKTQVSDSSHIWKWLGLTQRLDYADSDSNFVPHDPNLFRIFMKRYRLHVAHFSRSHFFGMFKLFFDVLKLFETIFGFKELNSALHNNIKKNDQVFQTTEVAVTVM